MMGTREEGRSGRVRSRPKSQPAKKTRVNAQRYLTVCHVERTLKWGLLLPEI